MATTTNYSWTTPDDTALVKDGAAAIRSLGTAIDTTVFNNASAAISKTIVDAKGDIIAATAADTVARLAVGSNNQVLTADSSTATGLKWTTPAAGGKVLQVVQGTLTSDASTTSGSYVDTGLTVSITPSAATSKIMVIVNYKAGSLHTGTQSANLSAFNLVRDSTQLQGITFGIDKYSATAGAYYNAVALSYLDSPATTSSTTYKSQFLAATANTTAHLFAASTSIASIVAMEIGA